MKPAFRPAFFLRGEKELSLFEQSTYFCLRSLFDNLIAGLSPVSNSELCRTPFHPRVVACASRTAYLLHIYYFLLPIHSFIPLFSRELERFVHFLQSCLAFGRMHLLAWLLAHVVMGRGRNIPPPRGQLSVPSPLVSPFRTVHVRFVYGKVVGTGERGNPVSF